MDFGSWKLPVVERPNSQHWNYRHHLQCCQPEHITYGVYCPSLTTWNSTACLPPTHIGVPANLVAPLGADLPSFPTSITGWVAIGMIAAVSKLNFGVRLCKFLEGGKSWLSAQSHERIHELPMKHQLLPLPWRFRDGGEVGSLRHVRGSTCLVSLMVWIRVRFVLVYCSWITFNPWWSKHIQQD